MSRYAYRTNISLPVTEGVSRIRTKSVCLNKPNGPQGTEVPEIFMWAGSESLFVSADLRSFGLDDLQVRVQGMRLIFLGTLRSASRPERRGSRRTENSSTTFYHALELPYEVRDDEAEVQNEDGLISIVLKRKETGRQTGRAAQSSFQASMQRFFGENGDSPRNRLKDEITMLETFERYLAFQSVKGSAR